MKNLLPLLFLFLISSCSDSDQPLIDFNKTETKAIDSLKSTIDVKSERQEVLIPQTKEARIAEIKTMYGQFLIIEPNDEKVCKSKTKKYTSDLVVKGMEFENSAQSCKFEEGFSYKKVSLSGYEWATETVFYYKNNLQFFTYSTGASEGWAFEQRIYYDKEGNVIQILEDENDGGGSKPTLRKDVTRVNRGEEILNDLKANLVKYAEIMK